MNRQPADYETAALPIAPWGRKLKKDRLRISLAVDALAFVCAVSLVPSDPQILRSSCGADTYSISVLPEGVNIILFHT